MRIAELTTGSGLAGLHLLMLESRSTLAGMDVDPESIAVAVTNARTLGLAERANFECLDLWSDAAVDMLRAYKPHVIICNPPYVPEPPGKQLEPEAGSGPNGTAHLLRAIELARKIVPKTLVLSWCSLSDPGRITREAEAAGYSLDSLFIVAIADGEYSGSVRDYLRTLPHAYINERSDTVSIVAPDRSGTFAFLLMAGAFSQRRRGDTRRGAAEAVERICRDFATRGLAALERPVAPIPVRAWVLDRWDEVQLRAFLHGKVTVRGQVPA
jgi:hypothetical protein